MFCVFVKMPSFDTVSEIDLQVVDDSINSAKREIDSRYDFKGKKYEMTFDRDSKKILLLAPGEYYLEQIVNFIRIALAKFKVDLKVLDIQEFEKAGGQNLRQEIKIREGIDKDSAKLLTKLLKQSALKIQTSIQGDSVRVTGKKRDDLQEAMNFIRNAQIDVPVQFKNFKD